MEHHWQTIMYKLFYKYKSEKKITILMEMTYTSVGWWLIVALDKYCMSMLICPVSTGISIPKLG